MIWGHTPATGHASDLLLTPMDQSPLPLLGKYTRKSAIFRFSLFGDGCRHSSACLELQLASPLFNDLGSRFCLQTQSVFSGEIRSIAPLR